MNIAVTLIVLLALLSPVSNAYAQGQPHERPSILQAKGESVRLRLLDASSGQPITNAEVTIRSDNGIRCIRASCPVNGKEWHGRSDARGQVVIPSSALQRVTSISTPAHHGDLIEDTQAGASGAWVAELLLMDSSATPPRPLKLIDARRGTPIAHAPVRIDFRTEDGERDSVNATTNALGWVFVPFEVAALATERSWIVVPGYRRTQVDFAWARRKTRLERL